MNSLLKRQIRKHLSEALLSNNELKLFIDAVDKSYTNFDEQFIMIQRAMSISSEELFIANKQLKDEAKSQQKIINKLKNLFNTLKIKELEELSTAEKLDIDGSKLVAFIDKQTKEIIQINEQREKLFNELELQNQELSDYAHMVSHDLKSPLRNIDTLTAWLYDDYYKKLDDSGKESITHIRRNVKKLDTLISGILEYSTIGKTKITKSDIDINNIIEEIVNIIEIPKKITLEVANLPIVKADRYRLQQVFQNLIENAIKYNDKEKGIIKIRFEELNKHWKFSIEDNGKGIEEKFFEKIFKTFSKLENNIESNGIGLSVVKKIIEVYNGKIWVESKLGVGTIFHFTLLK